MNLQAHHRQQVLNAIALLTAEATEQQRRRPMGPTHRQLEIAAWCEVLVDAGRLELAADTQPRDAVLALAHQGTAAEQHVSLSGAHLAGDHIQEGGLTGAIGADHGPKLTRGKLQVEVVEGKEAVKTDGHTPQFQQWHGGLGGG